MVRKNTGGRWLLPFVAAGLLAGCQSDGSGGHPVAPPSEARLSTYGHADAETLFRGIMFGDGQTASELPVIWDNYRTELLVNTGAGLSQEYLLDVENRLVNNVKAIDPNFLPRFKTAMNSGDHVWIRGMLDTAATIIVEAMHYTVEGDSVAYYEANPALVDSRLQPYLDPNGNLSLGDTAVTTAEASDELTRHVQTIYEGGGTDDCTPEPYQIQCETGAGIMIALGAVVYIVAAVHVLSVYNVAIAVVWGRWVALEPKKPWGVDSDLLKDQLIDSIATMLVT